jgi:hypothetical protein
MKSVKWFYVGAMAIALGMLTFATVACHDDDDDPKPAKLFHHLPSGYKLHSFS